MKANRTRLLGSASLVAAIGMIFVSCDDKSAKKEESKPAGSETKAHLDKLGKDLKATGEALKKDAQAEIDKHKGTVDEVKQKAESAIQDAEAKLKEVEKKASEEAQKVRDKIQGGGKTEGDAPEPPVEGGK